MIVPPPLVGPRVTIRPGGLSDIEPLRRVLGEDGIRRWWGLPAPAESVAADLAGGDGDQLLVVEIDGTVAGGIQYGEHNEPMYRHASIDIFISDGFAGDGIGSEAVRLLARWLVDVRHHHRITIDPAAANERAIRCYQRVGFRPVGVLREYEQGPDGTFHNGLLMDLVAAELT